MTGPRIYPDNTAVSRTPRAAPGLLDLLRSLLQKGQQGAEAVEQRIASGLPEGTLRGTIPEYIEGPGGVPKIVGKAGQALRELFIPKALRKADRKEFVARAKLLGEMGSFEKKAFLDAEQGMRYPGVEPGTVGAPRRTYDAFEKRSKEYWERSRNFKRDEWLDKGVGLQRDHNRILREVGLTEEELKQVNNISEEPGYGPAKKHYPISEDRSRPVGYPDGKPFTREEGLKRFDKRYPLMPAHEPYIPTYPQRRKLDKSLMDGELESFLGGDGPHTSADEYYSRLGLEQYGREEMAVREKLDALLKSILERKERLTP